MAYCVCVFRLWSRVSDAILKSDQHLATSEKYVLEEGQRQAAKERRAKLEEWIPKLFERNELTGDWMYKYAE